MAHAFSAADGRAWSHVDKVRSKLFQVFAATSIELANRAFAVMSSSVPILGLHHFAWRCRDSEETRRFYEDLLGLPLVHVIKSDVVPSTGEYCPYVHIFFQMEDGSFIAFFDLGDDIAALPSPNTPAWVNHIALRVPSVEHVAAAKARLEAAGVDVVGITDHHIIESIYFFDPNGFRIELTSPSVPRSTMLELAGHAHEDHASWQKEKQQRRVAIGG